MSRLALLPLITFHCAKPIETVPFLEQTVWQFYFFALGLGLLALAALIYTLRNALVRIEELELRVVELEQKGEPQWTPNKKS